VRTNHRHGGHRPRSMPVKRFLLRYAREKDLALFTAAGRSRAPTRRRSCPCGWWFRLTYSPSSKRLLDRRSLVSAFLLIDMVTASVTTSIGMFQLPPVWCRRHEDPAVCHGGWLEPAGWIFA